MIEYFPNNDKFKYGYLCSAMKSRLSTIKNLKSYKAVA